jgi:hypothetical protein
MNLCVYFSLDMNVKIPVRRFAFAFALCESAVTVNSGNILKQP